MIREPIWLCVPPDHPALAGHFPGMPIVPGAVLLDELLHSIDAQAASWRIASVKFHRVVRAQEPLRLDSHPGPRGDLQVAVHSGEDLVLSAMLQRPEP